ncbi:unnamed protein product (macronuclear) [Paramecium tetraurelia]|uniref:Clathrin adaptor alpha/beta/gamma-adaptin appendage Ig-like subdomain domain-containing protein n=1 Tax=Paramecium tetraurelia TaxID=5888 RepID=A0CWN8_PARTE|nr:uncharacterized protein GSPATT00001408001 [Paramecium tetraurelia]CAK75205.1 unnamed protein product [Paramecium tetraurelia]|eukprot:XP_001442602.1 hypothetical protein (macronuclear) [Paramecium tetraurelia strain d4-2]
METQILRQYLSSNETYQKTEEFKLKILYSDIYFIKQLQSSIVKIIKDPFESPNTKLMALKLNKELVETFNSNYIYALQKTLLPLFEDIAKYKYTSDDPDRGVTYFLNGECPNSDNRDLQVTGEQFFRVVLECIRVWSRWFPLDYQSYYLSSFKIVYEKLVKLGVKFPKIIYFENIQENIPHQLIPLSMIIQLRELLKNQVNLSTKQIRNYLAMNPAHLFYQHKYTTYSDFFYQIKNKNPVLRKKVLRKATFLLEKEFENLENMKKDPQYNPISSDTLQIENLCLQNLYNALSIKVPELQTQVIQLQNKVVSLEKQLLDREQKINELQNEIQQLQKQFSLNINQFLTSNDLSNSQLFQTDVTKLKLHFGIYDQSYEIEKLKSLVYKSDFKIEELNEKLDETIRKKNQLQEENKTLNQTLLVLERRLIQNTKQPIISTQQCLSEYRPNTMTNISQTGTMVSKKQKNSGFQNSLLLSLRQQVLGQQLYIKALQNQLIKFDKFLLHSGHTNSVLSYNTASTQYKVPMYSPKSFSQPKSRGSNEITSPFVDYDGKIFAILPDAFTVKFRQSCLLKKSILYSDDNLQIGVQTSLQSNQQLLINVVLHNRTKEQIQNLCIAFQKSQNLQFQAYPANIQQSLKGNEQVSQKVFIQFEQLPYQLLEFSINYKIQTQLHSIKLCLPCTVNKFFNFLEVPQECPQSYFYNSKIFQTSFQNQIGHLLPDFQINQINEQFVEAFARIQIEKSIFLISISSKNNQMQIKLNGNYSDKLVECIVSTYQGLFMKR